MKYIHEFEGLRGIMAWWVVLGHWSTTALIPYRIAHTKLFNGYAVDVFVILSGFAITALIDKRPERYGMFIKRRFLRIFPVYLFFLALSVATAPLALQIWQQAPGGYMQDTRIQMAQDSLKYFWPHVIAHLSALHGLVPLHTLPNTSYAFLGQAWSISLEWQFYLVAPFLIYILRPNPTVKQMTMIAIAVPIVIFISQFFPKAFLGANLHNFLIGIMSFHFLKARLNGTPSLQFSIIPLWFFGMIFLIFLKSAQVIPYMVWFTALLIIISSRENDNGLAKRLSSLLNLPISQKMGSMAYSVYLSHMLVILASLYLLEALGIYGLLHTVSLFAMTIIGTLLVSTLSYNWIEKPFHDLGRSLRDRKAVLSAGTQ